MADGDSNFTNLAASGTLSVAGAAALNGGATIATAKTLAVADADALSIGGVKLGTAVVLEVPFRAAGDLVDQWAFIADRAYQVTAIKEVHTVASTSGTMLPRKITDTSAPGAGAGATVKDFLTAALNTNTAANTIQTGTLSATGSDLQLAAGDKIGIKTGGTATGLAGGLLTIVMKAI